jgi:hypothetical protein
MAPANRASELAWMRAARPSVAAPACLWSRAGYVRDRRRSPSLVRVLSGQCLCQHLHYQRYHNGNKNSVESRTSQPGSAARPAPALWEGGDEYRGSVQATREIEWAAAAAGERAEVRPSMSPPQSESGCLRGEMATTGPISAGRLNWSWAGSDEPAFSTRFEAWLNPPGGNVTFRAWQPETWRSQLLGRRSSKL